MAEKKKPAAREEVILQKDHRHGGEDKKKGDSIRVTAAQKEWLAKHGVI